MNALQRAMLSTTATRHGMIREVLPLNGHNYDNLYTTLHGMWHLQYTPKWRRNSFNIGCAWTPKAKLHIWQWPRKSRGELWYFNYFTAEIMPELKTEAHCVKTYHRQQIRTYFSLHLEFKECNTFQLSITLVARFKAWTVFARSNTGIMSSHPTWGMDVCVRLSCVCAVLCAGRGLATGWSPVQGVLPTV
jgi:hypothetical protein